MRLVLLPGSTRRKEILFVRPPNPRREHYIGKFLSPEEARARTGIDTVFSSAEFDAFLASMFNRRPYGLTVDHVIEMSQIFIAQSAQSIRDLFWISHFGPDKPERINKRQSGEFPPVFAKVPEEEFASILLPETDGLIADEQLRAMAGS